MNPHTQKLLNAIADYESKCGISPSFSVLDALWYDYSCRNPIDDGRLRQAEKNLSPVFEELSMEASDCLSDQIVDLLNAYQRAAYLEGLCTGANLLRELTKKGLPFPGVLALMGKNYLAALTSSAVS